MSSFVFFFGFHFDLDILFWMLIGLVLAFALVSIINSKICSFKKAAFELIICLTHTPPFTLSTVTKDCLIHLTLLIGQYLMQIQN